MPGTLLDALLRALVARPPNRAPRSPAAQANYRSDSAHLAEDAKTIVDLRLPVARILPMTNTTWTVRGKVSGRNYTATPAGRGFVRLTHKSGVSSVMDATIVARDYETVPARKAR